jgi:polysaccharide deacetylase family protein (PEP-CTERM system associated)
MRRQTSRTPSCTAKFDWFVDVPGVLSMPNVTVSKNVFVSPPADRPMSGTESIFSVDVEDWYHILQLPSAPPRSAWHTLPARAETNFLRLLDLFSERDVHVTCFFLGWIAERFPHLVKEAVRRGHEIASHGYDHRLIFEMTQSEFLEDALRSRRLLEDIAGCAVRGYRAAGFSVIERTPWFFDKLLEASYEYDSSVFPSARQHGGIKTAIRQPHHIVCESGVLTEFPITVSNLYHAPLCFSGGGYLRLSPMWLILRMAKKVTAEGRPVIYYIHPREIDPSHRRLPMSMGRRFKCYVNLRTTEKKIVRIVREFPFITFGQFLDRYRDTLRYSHVLHPNTGIFSVLRNKLQLDLQQPQQPSECVHKPRVPEKHATTLPEDN